MGNCKKKRRFWLKSLLLDISVIVSLKKLNFFRDRTSESWRPKNSKNVVLFGRARFLGRVFAAQIRIRSAKVEVSPKLGGVKKKRHGHNFDFSDSPLNQRGPHMVGSTLIPCQAWKIKIVAVSFFLTPHFAFKKNWKITRLWQPISSL